MLTNIIVELWAFPFRPSPSIDAIDQSTVLCTAVELLCSDRRNIRGGYRAQTVPSQPGMDKKTKYQNGTRTWLPQSSSHIWRAVSVTWATTATIRDYCFEILHPNKKSLFSVQALVLRLIITLGLIKVYFPLFQWLSTFCTPCRRKSTGRKPGNWTLQINWTERNN